MKAPDRDLIINCFPILFPVLVSYGNIKEDLCDELNFPKKFGPTESGVDCNVGIEHEHMQRAKPLTRPEQIILCDNYQEDLRH